MSTERDQPWWADAQEYRHRETRRRPTLDDVPSRSPDEYAANAARRRRAAAARASAQERRARQRRPEPEEFGWIDESPFAPIERTRSRPRPSTPEGQRRAAERSRRPGGEVARRPSSRVSRRRTTGLLARPEKLLLYIALLGLFLVLAAASNSDAAVVHQAASSLTR
jgi:hypothetical protein